MGALKPRFRAEHSVITHLSFDSLATSISSINLDCLAMLKVTTLSTRWALLIATMGLLSACSDAESTVTDDSARWYTPEQLAKGKVILANNCAACHGSKAEGVANWQTPDSNGLYPAPILTALPTLGCSVIARY